VKVTCFEPKKRLIMKKNKKQRIVLNFGWFVQGEGNIICYDFWKIFNIKIIRIISKNVIKVDIIIANVDNVQMIS